MKETKIAEKIAKIQKKVGLLPGKETTSEVERFMPDPDFGLTEEQAALREHSHLLNRKPINRSKSVARIVFDNFFNFCSIITIALVILLVAIGAADYAVSSCIIFISIAIGIAQELRAKRTVGKLSMFVDCVCTVRREGKEKEISTRDIALDDIYLLKSGLQVPVDSIVKQGEVEVDESILTGESVPVKRKEGDTVLAASIVVSGEAAVQAERVGKDCYIETVAKIARRITKPHSNIFSVLNKLIMGITFALVPLAVLLLISNLTVSSENLHQTAINVSSVVLGMIPVGMFLLTSTALAASVLKLSKKKTLAQDLYGIEMLAMVDTLLLDKTGTITSGQLEIAETKVFLTDETDNAANNERLEEIIGALFRATGDGNSTATAFRTRFAGGENIIIDKSKPFSSKRKYSGIQTEGVTYVVGAPDFVAVENAEIEEFSNCHAEKCRRSLLFVRFDGEIDDFSPEKAVPLMLFALEDQLRDDVKDTLRWFAENDVDIKIVSGDNPLTVSSIAEKSGVVHAENYVNCAHLTDAELSEKALQTTVFGRVSPEQKSMLVKTLKKKGRVVGMIGDGVNDVQALKHADCSISFASANEVARNVSRIVLLDSNFKSMPGIVEEGRSVIGNIEKVASLYLMKNIFVMVFTLIFAISGFISQSVYFPFDTKKLLLIEFFVIGVPTFAIALQPNRRRVDGKKFLKNILQATFPAALSLIVAVGVMFLVCRVRNGFSMTPEQLQYEASLATLALTLAGFSALMLISLPPDKWRFTVIGVMMIVTVGGLVLDASVFKGIFLNIDFPIGMDYLYLLLSVVAATAVNLVGRKVFSKFRKVALLES